MLRLNNICINKEGCDVRDLNIQADNGETHVILSTNILFLKGMLEMFLRLFDENSGDIYVNEKDFRNVKNRSAVCVLSKENKLYDYMNVADNILFSDKSPLRMKSRQKIKSIMDDLFAETGFYISPRSMVGSLPYEQKKIVELLQCFYERPDLLVIHEWVSLFSFENQSRILNVIDKMKEKGCTVLYLTSQWEETVRVADRVTIVSTGDSYETHDIIYLRNNPSKIYYLLMSGERLISDGESDYVAIEPYLRATSENVNDIASGFNLERTLQGLMLYLKNKIKADSCRIYLKDEIQDNIINIVSNVGENENSLSQETVMKLLGIGERQIFLKTDLGFAEKYASAPNCYMTIVIPISMSSVMTGLIQLDYLQQYELSAYEKHFIQWVVSEIAIVIENSRLMGRSVLLQESYHRIKNNLQIIISLIEMERDAITDKLEDEKVIEIFDDTIDKIISRVQSIANVHNLLAQDKVKGRVIDLYLIINETCRMYYMDTKITLDFEVIYVPYTKAISVALVINELISNSIKHNQDNPDLKITISGKERKDEQVIQLIYRDNGKGFSEEVNPDRKSHGVGIRIINAIICGEFGGSIRFENDNGALVLIEIPILPFLKMK